MKKQTIISKEQSLPLKEVKIKPQESKKKQLISSAIKNMLPAQGVKKKSKKNSLYMHIYLLSLNKY